VSHGFVSQGRRTFVGRLLEPFRGCGLAGKSAPDRWGRKRGHSSLFGPQHSQCDELGRHRLQVSLEAVVTAFVCSAATGRLEQRQFFDKLDDDHDTNVSASKTIAFT